MTKARPMVISLGGWSSLSFIVQKTDLVQALNIVYNLVNKSIILHK